MTETIMEDPFAGLEFDVQDYPEPEPESKAPIPNRDRTKSVFVFDLETVPDESRFPRPVRQEKVERPDHECTLSALQGSAVPAIKRIIPLLSATQLDSLLSMERSAKKPRSTVTELIEKQIEFDNTDPFEMQMAEWKKLSFNPFGNRIVALGIEAKGHSITMLAKTPDEERELLRVLWQHINEYRTRCGYNITAFDDAVLIFRSMLLGVDGYPISRKKFANFGSIDLMTAIFPAGQAQKLKEVCKMLGIVPLAGYEMSGDQVFDLVEAGDWDGIANYVHSDAVIEFELYNRLANYVNF